MRQLDVSVNIFCGPSCIIHIMVPIFSQLFGTASVTGHGFACFDHFNVLSPVFDLYFQDHFLRDIENFEKVDISNYPRQKSP